MRPCMTMPQWKSWDDVMEGRLNGSHGVCVCVCVCCWGGGGGEGATAAGQAWVYTKCSPFKQPTRIMWKKQGSSMLEEG